MRNVMPTIDNPSAQQEPPIPNETNGGIMMEYMWVIARSKMRVEEGPPLQGSWWRKRIAI